MQYTASIYRKIPYKRPLLIKSIGRISANWPSKCKYQLKDPSSLLHRVVWMVFYGMEYAGNVNWFWIRWCNVNWIDLFSGKLACVNVIDSLYARCWVKENYFLSNGKDRCGAMRVSGEDHVIIRNYVADNFFSSGSRTGLTLRAGDGSSTRQVCYVTSVANKMETPRSSVKINHVLINILLSLDITNNQLKRRDLLYSPLY